MILNDDEEKQVIAFCETLLPKDYAIMDYKIRKNPKREFDKTASVYLFELEIADEDGKTKNNEFELQTSQKGNEGVLNERRIQRSKT